MKAVTDINICINTQSGNTNVLICLDDGSQEIKSIGFDDLVRILQNSVDVKRFVNLGRLPRGYYNGAIAYGDESTYKVALLLPAELRMLLYFNDCYTIPFPELLFLFKVSGGNLIQSSCFSVYTENGIKKIANYPFGNVHQDGSICWGNNTSPICNFVNSDKYVELFLGSETNNDLYKIGKNVVNKKIFINQRGLLLALENKKKFPESWLIKREYTLDNFINEFLV